MGLDFRVTCGCESQYLCETRSIVMVCSMWAGGGGG